MVKACSSRDGSLSFRSRFLVHIGNLQDRHADALLRKCAHRAAAGPNELPDSLQNLRTCSEIRNGTELTSVQRMINTNCSACFRFGALRQFGHVSPKCKRNIGMNETASKASAAQRRTGERADGDLLGSIGSRFSPRVHSPHDNGCCTGQPA